MVGANTVIVRHLPACLTPTEKTDLLQYFGAKEVRVMPCHGRMKHTAFATFGDCEDAKKAIARLHQVELHDSVLSVEFAKEKSSITTSSQISNTNQKPTPDEKVDKSGKDKGIDPSPIAPHLGIHYPSDPGLKYCYPPVSGDILLNICSALAAVPKFYTQVLHLMNKMQLIPPFSPATTIPPMVLKRIKEIYQISPELFVTSVGPAEMPKDPDKLEVIEMSESESEYESSESEGEGKLRALNMDVPDRVIRTRKRKMRHAEDRVKRKKLKQLVTKPTPINSPAVKTANVSDAFGETAVVKDRKQIEIKVQAPISEYNTDSVTVTHSTEGFGKIQPANSTQTDLHNVNDCEQEEKVLKDFITRKQLFSGRLNQRDMKSSSVFENYTAGDATCRLYVKNLSKRVTEKDLEFIYGSFVNYDKEHEKNSFNIQLLKQGRMKGQAFVSFSSVETAADALTETNGYQLMNKPMVVHFARSKKPKEPQK